MSEETYEAANVEAALAQAAESLGASPDNLQYEVVEEKTDFWGADEGTVVIKVWRADEVAAPLAEVEQESGTRAEVEPRAEVGTPGEPEAAAEEAEPTGTDTGRGFWDGDEDVAAAEEAEEEPPEAEEEPPEAEEEPPEAEEEPPEAEEEPPEAHEEIIDAAPEPAPVVPAADEGEGVEPESVAALLRQIFHDMDFDCEIEIEKQEDGIFVAVSGADKDLLLEGNGRCLSALELILNNAFRHRLPSGQKVRVDAGDFRSRREEELADLAFQVAHSAKETGRTQETQPLNPYERRLVHLALAEDSSVTTRSRGSGFLKNVQVIPRRSGGGNRRR